jgi:mannose-6-phosphate isomerase-like protein (cupin superfamily)
LVASRRFGPGSIVSAQTIRIVVGEDQPIFPDAIVHVLEENGLEVVSTASDAPELALLRTCQTVDEKTSKTRLDPESPERFVSLRRALGVTTFGINQMVLQPGQRMRIHRHHRQEEVYLVLEGRLTVAVEAHETELGAGELMRVAPQVRRQLVNRGPDRVLLIALGADGDHEGRDAEAFTSWDESTGASPREVPLPDDLDSQELRS